MLLSFNLILTALPVIHALVLQKLHESDDYDHALNVLMPPPKTSQTWYHPKDHPVHALFKRATDDNEANIPSYAPVGSSGTSI